MRGASLTVAGAACGTHLTKQPAEPQRPGCSGRRTVQEGANHRVELGLADLLSHGDGWLEGGGRCVCLLGSNGGLNA